jgi:hypothetical protein
MASAPADVSESALPGLLAWPIERTPAVVAASTSVTVSPTSTHSAATNAAGMGRLAEDEASGRRHYVGLGFHDLRRASATSLVAAGVDVKTAQTVLALGRPADARPLRPGRDGAAAGGGRRHGGEVHRRVAAGKRGAEPPTGDRQDPAENGGEGL